MNKYLFFASAGECADMLISTSCHLLDNRFEISFDSNAKINTTDEFYKKSAALGFYRHNWRARKCRNFNCTHEFVKDWFKEYNNILYVYHTTEHDEYQRWFLFLAKTIWYNKPDWNRFKIRYNLNNTNQITKEHIIDYVNFRYKGEAPIDKESVLKVLGKGKNAKTRHYCKINFRDIFNNYIKIISQLSEYFDKEPNSYLYDKWAEYLLLNQKLADTYYPGLQLTTGHIDS